MNVRIIAVTMPVVSWIYNQEQLCEYAGRICTHTTGNVRTNTEGFLKARIDQGHESILEHVSITFEIRGISRACLAQLTRYRLASFSVESQRYVKYDNLDAIFPPCDCEQSSIIAKAFTEANAAYKDLLITGMKPEDARFVLPMATKTNLVMTANLRELRHIFSQRLDKAAQWEIRELATRMLKLADEYAPTVFEEFMISP